MNRPICAEKASAAVWVLKAVDIFPVTTMMLIYSTGADADVAHMLMLMMMLIYSADADADVAYLLMLIMMIM